MFQINGDFTFSVLFVMISKLIILNKQNLSLQVTQMSFYLSVV